jgi:hypothetical protein
METARRRRPMENVQLPLVVLTVVLAGGCAAHRVASTTPAGQELFAGDLQELAPHHDGDEWTYRVTGNGLLDGVYVERVSAASPGGEFVAETTKDGKRMSRMQLRSDGKSIVVESHQQDFLGLRSVYDPPLPYISVPLRAGTTSAEGRVHLVHIDGQPIADCTIEVTQTVSAASPGTNADFEVQSEHRLSMGDERMVDHTTTWFRRGVGEVYSESTSNGTTVRVGLICAKVGGQNIGACDADAP